MWNRVCMIQDGEKQSIQYACRKMYNSRILNKCPLRQYNAPHWRHLAPNGQRSNDHTLLIVISHTQIIHTCTVPHAGQTAQLVFCDSYREVQCQQEFKELASSPLVSFSSEHARNWTWFTRPFFLMRGRGLGMRLKVNLPTL